MKICGLTRLEDAENAAAAGADLLGAILSPGFGRSVPAAQAATYVERTGLPLVGVSVDAPIDDLIGWAHTARVSVLQLHGNESPERLDTLRNAGEWQLWKAIRVRDAADIEQALLDYAEVADGLVFDGWSATQAGGTGTGFLWDLLEDVRHRIPRSLTLITAGGLEPTNVREAVRRMRPDVVDVSSGVESSKGIKSAQRMRDFISNARRASTGRSTRHARGSDDE